MQVTGIDHEKLQPGTKSPNENRKKIPLFVLHLSIHQSWNASPQSLQTVNAPSRTRKLRSRTNNQQNSPVKIKSGKANQEKTNQRRQQTQKQSNASESKTETKQADNGNQKQQQQKRSEKQQQQQSKLELNQDGGDNAEIPRMEKEAKPKPKKPTVVLAGEEYQRMANVTNQSCEILFFLKSRYR